jgi:hypothetical protein
MSKRLQVVVGDADLAGYERTAQAAGVSMSAWVRQALSVAQREASSGNVDAKLTAIRRAAGRNLTDATDIETMLADIETGYLPAGEV